MSEKNIIDSRTLGRYFSKKWQTNRCSFCGHNVWDAACKENGNLRIFSMTGEYSQEDGVTFIDGGNIGDPPGEIESGEALVTVRCRNCNYVAHFDLKGIQDEVRKWKAQ